MDCCSTVAAPGSFDLAVLFTTGLTVSLGHCVGMCGPLVSAFAVAQEPCVERRWTLVPSLLRYGAGRVLSYGALGLALGSLGAVLLTFGWAAGVQASLSLAIGAVMMVLALGLVGWIDVPRWASAAPVGRFLSRRVARLARSRRWEGQFALGVANGLLPCGPVMAVGLSAAAAGSALHGSAAMLAYGAGTIPVLVAVGLGASRLAPRAQVIFHRLGAALVLAIGLQLVLRGLAALQLFPHARIAEVVLW